MFPQPSHGEFEGQASGPRELRHCGVYFEVRGITASQSVSTADQNTQNVDEQGAQQRAKCDEDGKE